jgi:hypothetical protein
MKTKKFDKKLFLNKKTIADLGISEMNKVAGGITGLPCEHSGPPCSIRPFCTQDCTWDCSDPIQCPSAPWTNCTDC